MKTTEQLAKSTDPAMVRAFGAIRRFVVTLTDTAIWQIAGVLMPDGREAMRAEVFGGVGFYARPSSSGTPEAIVAMAGGAQTPAVVGVRDEKTRAAVVKEMGGEPAPDTTIVHNSVAVLVMLPNGKIEARSPGGVAVELALKSDVQEVVTKHNVHTHAVATTGTAAAQTGTAAATTDTAANPSGTQKFRAE